MRTRSALASALAMLVAALALPAAAATAAAPATTSAAGIDTHFQVFLLDSTRPCLHTQVELGVSKAHRSTEFTDFWSMFIDAENRCTGETLLHDFEYQFGAPRFEWVRVSPNLRSAAVDFSGVINGDGDVLVTFDVDMTYTFATPKGSGGSANFVTCIPLETDPETGDPVPGTAYSKERLLSTGGTRTGQLLDVNGSFTVRLTDGTVLEFLTQSAEQTGGISRFAGTAVYQVTSPVDKCTDSSRQ